MLHQESVVNVCYAIFTYSRVILLSNVNEMNRIALVSLYIPDFCPFNELWLALVQLMCELKWRTSLGCLVHASQL